MILWSGRRDLNPRLRPWQGRTLPLSYSRSYKAVYRTPQIPGNRRGWELPGKSSFLPVVIKAEVAVKPDDVKCRSITISYHRGSLVKAKRDDINIFGDIRRDSSADFVSFNFFISELVPVRSPNLLPCKLAQLM